MTKSQKRYLFVGAHPDGPDIRFGGTIEIKQAAAAGISHLHSFGMTACGVRLHSV